MKKRERGKGAPSGGRMSRTLDDALREEKALRELARTSPDALAAYRRLVARANVYAGAVNRIASFSHIYESTLVACDTMRAIAVDAIRDVEEVE